jgi:hypothetical protein
LKIYALSPLSGANFWEYLLKNQKREGKNLNLRNLRREPLKQKQKKKPQLKYKSLKTKIGDKNS